ncbi:BatD family protein [Pontibacter sp. JAM-7]|uniref:BatD family protein n=1 Tax=Pontibacter sp. JAM-7 TaxID=3366581 RepID=UPI003AF58583
MIVRVVTALLLICLSVSVQAEISSQVDRNAMEQGESFLLVLNISQSGAQDVDLSPLEQDFEILGRRHKSSTSIINGDIQSSTRLLISLAPKRAGTLTVPVLNLNGEQTQAHQIEVAPVKLQSAVDGGVELLSTLSDTTPLVQQPLVYQLSLVLGQRIANAMFEEPRIRQGRALIQPLGEQRQHRQELNGREILVVEQSWLITPQQSGPLSIEAAKLSADVAKQAGPYRRFSDPRALRRIYLSADSYQLDVAPIPAGFQGSNWLMAKKLQISSELSSAELKVGEPVTRIIKIQADGISQEQLADIELPEVPGVKQYKAKPVFSQQQMGNELSANMTLEVTMIPGQQGSVTLPEVKLHWWNIVTNREETALLPEQRLNVAAGIASSTSVSGTPSAGADISVSGKDETVQTRPTTRPANPPIPERWHATEGTGSWFWVFMAAAVLTGGLTGGLLTLILCRRKLFPGTPVAVAETSAAVISSPKAALRMLAQACADNDPLAAREALLAWGRATIPGCTQLNHLLVRVSPDLKAAIIEMNACCYGRHPADWHGDELLRQVQQQSCLAGAGKAERLAALIPA